MMNVLINHCWCSDSNWGGNYNCRVIVSINRISEGKAYHDVPTEDWTNLLDEHAFDPDPESRWGLKGVRRLKPEIIQWLNENVKDRKCDEHRQGWCVGTDNYNSKDPLSFAIFFERPRDAMRFIRRWSSFKNPFRYLNYFKDIRKELDPITNRLRQVPR